MAPPGIPRIPTKGVSLGLISVHFSGLRNPLLKARQLIVGPLLDKPSVS